MPESPVAGAVEALRAAAERLLAKFEKRGDSVVRVWRGPGSFPPEEIAGIVNDFRQALTSLSQASTHASDCGEEKSFDDWIEELRTDVVQGEYGYEEGEFTVYPDLWRPMFDKGISPSAAFKRALIADVVGRAPLPAPAWSDEQLDKAGEAFLAEYRRTERRPIYANENRANAMRAALAWLNATPQPKGGDASFPEPQHHLTPATYEAAPEPSAQGHGAGAGWRDIAECPNDESWIVAQNDRGHFMVWIARMLRLSMVAGTPSHLQFRAVRFMFIPDPDAAPALTEEARVNAERIAEICREHLVGKGKSEAIASAILALLSPAAKEG